MRGRAYRRDQWVRAKGRALRYLRWMFAGDPEWATAEKVVRFAVDRTPCSCRLCGNPRRFIGAVTRQELQVGLRGELSDAEPDVARYARDANEQNLDRLLAALGSRSACLTNPDGSKPFAGG